MAVALVGFDIDPKERLYGLSDLARSDERLRRNYALRRGTDKLYLTFLDLVRSLQLRRRRAEAPFQQIADLWEVLLIPLLWRNSQTRTPDYQDLLPSARLYWEANLSGFSWPQQTPTEAGIWAPLGSLAYFYFHYGVVNAPNDLFAYAQGALVLYWRFIGEAYGWGADSYYSLTPTERWQRLKEALGWVSLDYALLERVLLACWEGADRSLQLALRRALLSKEDLENVERSLLLGIASPRLINFLLSNRQALESLAVKLTGKEVSWQFSFPVLQRWKLGPGGLPQVLLSFLVEGLLFGIKLFRLYPDLKYGSFLAEESYRDQRLGLLQYVTLMHDALVWLGGLYSDVSTLYNQVYYMLVELLSLEERKASSRHRLFEGELTLDFWLQQIRRTRLQPNLSLLEAYPSVVASLVSPSPYDRVRLVNPPLVLRSGQLTTLKVEGRPGTAVKLVVLEGKPNTFLHSRAVLIGEDGYGYLPLLPWTTASTAQLVVFSIRSLELDEVSTTFEVLVQPPDSDAVLESLAEFNALREEPPLAELLKVYVAIIPNIYRRERELLEQAGPPPAERRNKKGGRGTNILGLLGNVFNLFQALSRTAPLNSNEKQQSKIEQASHYTSAATTAKRVQQASQVLKQQQQGVQPKVESVAPAVIKQEVQNFKEKVLPEAGRDLAAAGIAVADNQAAGRSLVQSHEVWQVNTQHARLQTTANFEVSSPHTLISSRLVDIQSRHRLGVHDSVQETAQYLSYRATKLRQVVAENAIDFNNRWYKATSANAHYVAGHHYQYGDELLLQVGRSQSNDETEQAEAAEDVAVSAVEEAEVSVEDRAEALSNDVNNAETIDAARDLNLTAQERIRSTVQQYLNPIDRFLRVFGNFDGSLGSLATAFNGLFGNGGVLSALFSLVERTEQVSQAIDSVLSLAAQVQAIVQQLQSALDPNNPDPPPQAQIDALASQLASLLNDDAVATVLAAIRVVEAAATERQTSLTQAVTTLTNLVNAIGAGQYNEAARRQPVSPHLTVLAGEGLSLLKQAARAIQPLAQILGSGVPAKIGSLFSATMQSVAEILPALSGLVGGNITGVINNATQIAGIASLFSNATSGYFSAAANGLLGGGVGGLGDAAQALTDLGLGSHLPLHPQNSQVQKYGHWIADVYKDVGINVRQGGMNIKLKRDFAVNTRLGRFNVRALRTAVIGRVSADFGSQGRTNLRGRVVTIKAASVIYLDAPKIVCSTRPVTGGVPAISSITTLLQQVQGYMDKINEYMAIITRVAQTLGLAGGSGNAPTMSSPAPLPTGQAPSSVTLRPSNADETPTGGASQSPDANGVAVVPTNPFAPELAYLLSQNLQPE